ncbi:hypothetical protein TNCV_2897471 [Trichonephila clavipes]|nr:hypothetical protein TNCV_2897471 [Trichonephila clavipes]
MVVIYRNDLSSLREFLRAKSYCHLYGAVRPTTGVHLAPCHDEFRGPRSDYVRQVALETTATCLPVIVICIQIPSGTPDRCYSPFFGSLRMRHSSYTHSLPLI